MSCNTLIDNRLQLKTNIPAYIGDFWLSKGSEKAKNIVRLFTRFQHGSAAWDYCDYVESKLTSGKPVVNSIPYNLDIDYSKITYSNLNPSNYISRSLDTDENTEEVPLRQINTNLMGVYGLDPGSNRVWQHHNGKFLLWGFSQHPDGEGDFFGDYLQVGQTGFVTGQPQFIIPIEGKIPTIILSKRGYLIYGLDFTVEFNNLKFTAPLHELFDTHVYVVSGYEKRSTLLGFPFSVDPETIGVDKISKYLRQNNSILNLREALCQVVGYTSVNDINIVYSQSIPEATVIADESGGVSVLSQEVQVVGPQVAGSFPGNPITLLQGSSSEVAPLIGPKTKFKLKTPVGVLELMDIEIRCTVGEDIVEIGFPGREVSDYANSARKTFESIPRYDDYGNPITRFSDYLKDKYVPGADVGETFYVNILREYLSFYGDNILIVLFSEKLNFTQIQTALDFLETHTPLNAIIMHDTLWE
jgi:hypothetical protein